MAWDQNLTNLNDVLAGLYPMTPDSVRVVAEAGLSSRLIAFQPRAIDNWFAILDEAQKSTKVSDLIKVARKDYPDNPVLKRAEEGKLDSVRGPDLNEDPWNSEISEEHLEKLMGLQSTLLEISFLEIGMQRSRSVARVKRADGSAASGFLTQKNLFVTNNHVLGSEIDAKGATIQFNFQKTVDGLDQEPVNFRLNPDDGFATSHQKDGDDWTVVRLKEDANADWGAIDLEPVDIKASQRVNIIQHPGGGPKQIALYHNIVAYTDEKRIQYFTDTLPGSSGSPVFDTDWRLVALHRNGGWIREPGTKKLVFRNQGINVNCIHKGLEGKGLL